MVLRQKAKFWGYNHHVPLFVQTEICPFWAFLDLNPSIRPWNIPQMWILSIPNEATQCFTPKKVYLIQKMQKIKMWDFFQRCVIVSHSVSRSVSYTEELKALKHNIFKETPMDTICGCLFVVGVWKIFEWHAYHVYR